MTMMTSPGQSPGQMPFSAPVEPSVVSIAPMPPVAVVSPKNRRGSLILTGRAGLVAAVGSVLVGVCAGFAHVPGWIGLCAFEAALAGMVAADYRLSTSLRDLVFERVGDSSARLGSTGTVQLGILNGGERYLRGTVRDSWGPSAGNHSGRQSAVEPRHEKVVAHTKARAAKRAAKAASAKSE